MIKALLKKAFLFIILIHKINEKFNGRPCYERLYVQQKLTSF